MIAPAGLVPTDDAVDSALLALHAARAQALLDRIAAVSAGAARAEGDEALEQVMHALGEREALLAELAPVVRELSRVRASLGRVAGAPAARAYALAVAPVEEAAGRALRFQEVLAERLLAMRAQLAGELARVDQVEAAAASYGVAAPSGGRLDVRR